MVKIIKKSRKENYQCEICKFKYADKKWAEKCEAWCRKNKSCNLEITKHALKEKGNEN